MNTMFHMLLFISAVAFAPQSAAQKTNQPRRPVASTRVPVDVSIQGLTVAPSTGAPTPFICVPSIADQAAAGCLMASSTPTFGLLFPYPGENCV